MTKKLEINDFKLNREEKKLLKRLGLKVSYISQRYYRAYGRVKKRQNASICSKEMFIRLFVNKYIDFKEKEKNQNVPIQAVDIHSITGSYASDNDFILLNRREHQKYHRELHKKQIELIKQINRATCKYCGRELEINKQNFRPNPKTLIGYEITRCRACLNKSRRELYKKQRELHNVKSR